MTKEQRFSDALAVQVERRIFLVRGQKVMLDTDLAELYRVPTKSLNLAVKRNADRFPQDFTFRLTDDEVAGLRFHFETSKRGRGGRRYLPYAFTEQGVAAVNVGHSRSRSRASYPSCGTAYPRGSHSRVFSSACRAVARRRWVLRSSRAVQVNTTCGDAVGWTALVAW